MGSRDNANHFLVIVLVFHMGIVATQFYAVGTNKQLVVLVGLINDSLLFGGAHLYLGWRGEGGMVPPSSRWRFLGALAIWLVLAAIGALGPDAMLAGVTVDTVLLLTGLIVLVSYWVLEARDGYRSRRPT